MEFGKGLPTGFEFSIFDSSLMKKKKLKLPKRVVWLYGETLPDSVFLKRPCGSEWEIGLTKSNGKVWLHHGWPEFVKHYSLGSGYLLIFTHEGNSHFQLSVCDASGSQVGYPSIPAHPNEPEVNKNPKVPQNDETEDDSDSVQILDSSSPCPNTEDESLPPSSPPRRRMRTTASDQPIKRARGDRFCQHPHCQAVETNSRQSQGKVTTQKVKTRKFKSVNQIATGQHTERRFRDCKAFEAANKFSSGKPFFKSVVTHLYYARVSSVFVKRHIEQKSQTVRLELGNRSWLVRLLNCKSGSFLSGGFHIFMKDNFLLHGDVCIFELIERKSQKGVALKVHIFRSNMV